MKARSRRQRRFIQSTKRITATKDGARDSSVVTDNGKEAECQDNIQGVAAAADSSDEASTSDNHESNSEEDVGSCMSVVDDRTADTQSDSSTESMDMGQGMVDTTNDTDEETSDDTRTESEEDVIGEPPNVTANCRSSSRAASETEVQSTVSIESEEADKMSSSQESPAENVNSHKRQVSTSLLDASTVSLQANPQKRECTPSPSRFCICQQVHALPEPTSRQSIKERLRVGRVENSSDSGSVPIQT